MNAGWIWWALSAVVLLSPITQAVVRRTFKRNATQLAISGITGGQLARLLLDRAGLNEVVITPAERLLDDRYDPHAKVLHLFRSDSPSLAVLSVTAHEVGHAQQHDQGYWGLRLRRALQPAGYLGAAVALAGLLAGWVLGQAPLVPLAGVAYLLAILLLLLTLPVELDANRRALAMLLAEGAVRTPEEVRAARRMLGAAVLTYVAAALSPVIHGVFLLWSNR